MEELTKRQRQVYDFVAAQIETRGFAPTLQEIAAHLQVRGNLGVMRHLAALEKKGWLRREAGRSRGIVLAQRAAASIALPLVGTVAAGNLAEAFEEVETHISVDPVLVKGDGSFVLRVKGDSMIGAQIAPGDLAIVRPQTTAENGDIVVALLDGEATLKRFFHEGERVRLQPENPRLEPILLHPEDGDLRILGRVTGIVRSLD